jgi:hypothetical protein
VGLGVGVCGAGAWGLGHNPQSPIPNPQSPIPNPQNLNNYIVEILINFIFILINI